MYSQKHLASESANLWTIRFVSNHDGPSLPQTISCALDRCVVAVNQPRLFGPPTKKSRSRLELLERSPHCPREVGEQRMYSLRRLAKMSRLSKSPLVCVQGCLDKIMSVVGAQTRAVVKDNQDTFREPGSSFTM